MNGLAVMLAVATMAMLSVAAVRAEDAPAEPKPEACPACAACGAEDRPTPAALNFTMKSITGEDVALAKYQGKVVLIVNVASKCGNTPQYADLQKIYTQYKDQGFVILGFPANNFGKQEPGNETQIKEFCSLKYNVTFPLFSKINVKGPDIAPLYQYLTTQETAPQPKGNITWNFEKFLISREGKIVARYSPKTKPTDEALTKTLTTELAKPR